MRKRRANRVAVGKISRLGNKSCHVPPSHVITNACLYTTTTTEDGVVLRGMPIRRLRSFVRMCQGVNKRCRMGNNALRIGKGGTIEPTILMRARVCPNFPASLRTPLVTILANTRKRDAVQRGVFSQEFNDTFRVGGVNTSVSMDKGRTVVEKKGALGKARMRTKSLENNTTLLVTTLVTRKRAYIAKTKFVDENCRRVYRSLQALNYEV